MASVPVPCPQTNQQPRWSTRFQDLTGKQFGHWTILSYAGKAKWNCKCSCGKKTMVFGSSLRKGHSTSCGCQRPSYYIDLTGQTFVHLKVLASAGCGPPDDRAWRWLCLCDCGIEKVISGASLRAGNATSCGCG